MDAEWTDIVVIGMGPGGEDAAGKLAQAGLHVTGVEANLVGGECPYWGCVPSKMMIRAGNLLAEARRIPGMAGASTVNPDWAAVARRIRMRPPTPGMTRSRWTGSRVPAGTSCAAAAGSPPAVR